MFQGDIHAFRTLVRQAASLCADSDPSYTLVWTLRPVADAACSA